MGDADGQHFLVKHISLGDVLTLIVSLTVRAFGYGRVSRDVESLTRAMEELQSRDITPGARSQLAVMQAQISTVQATDNHLREELKESRKELKEEMRAINEKLDRHMDGSK